MSRIGPPSFQLGVYRRPPLSRGSEFSTRRIEESASPRREFICPGCNPGPPTSSPDKNTQQAHPGCLTRHKQMPYQASMAEGLIAMVQLSVKTTMPGKVAHTQKRERRPVTPHPENCEILEILPKIKSEILEVLPKTNCEILEVQQFTILIYSCYSTKYQIKRKNRCLGFGLRSED